MKAIAPVEPTSAASIISYGRDRSEVVDMTAYGRPAVFRSLRSRPGVISTDVECRRWLISHNFKPIPGTQFWTNQVKDKAPALEAEAW